MPPPVSVTFALAWVENPLPAQQPRRPSAGCTGARPRSAHPRASSRSWSSTAAAIPERGPPGGILHQVQQRRQPRPGTQPLAPSATAASACPAAHRRPSGATCPDSSSAAPSATVCHDAPVTLATAPIPPSPAARATIPSVSRRDSSSQPPGAAAPAPARYASRTPRPRSYQHPGTRHAGNSVNYGMSTRLPGSSVTAGSSAVTGADAPPSVTRVKQGECCGVRDTPGAASAQGNPREHRL